MRYRRVPSLGADYIQTIARINILERIVQAIGFTPDFPYTLNVNDGTRNRVLIGKINGDYGIKIVNNAGVEIVFADGHISATGITTGTLDASIVNVTNLNADSIVAGTITATMISGGTLNCSLMTVSNLSASSITTGVMSGDRINVGTLDADRIKSHDITSDQLSTGELISQSAQIKDGVIESAHIGSLNAGVINAGTLNVDRLGTNSIAAVKLAVSQLSDIATNLGSITAGSITGNTITATSGGKVIIKGDNAIDFRDSGGTSRGYIRGQDTSPAKLIIYPTSNLNIQGNLYLGATSNYNLYCNAVGLNVLVFDTRSSAPSDSWALYMYSSGGYGLRTRMNGGNWQVDQTAI